MKTFIFILLAIPLTCVAIPQVDRTSTSTSTTVIVIPGDASSQKDSSNKTVPQQPADSLQQSHR